MRIVVDTNIWIHLLISRKSSLLERFLDDAESEILFSKESLAEITEVVSRAKFTKYFSSNETAELITLIESRFPIIEVVSKVSVCRDDKDNFLLALCKDGEADYLITGDSDLLILSTFGKTRIVTLSEFSSL